MNDQEMYRSAEPGDMSSAKARKGRPVKWPFLEMEIGATVAVDSASLHHAARSAATYASSVSGRRFRTRKMDSGVLLIRRIE